MRTVFSGATFYRPMRTTIGTACYSLGSVVPTMPHCLVCSSQSIVKWRWGSQAKDMSISDVLFFTMVVTALICPLPCDWAALVYRDKLEMGDNSNMATWRRGIEKYVEERNLPVGECWTVHQPICFVRKMQCLNGNICKPWESSEHLRELVRILKGKQFKSEIKSVAGSMRRGLGKEPAGVWCFTHALIRELQKALAIKRLLGYSSIAMIKQHDQDKL